MSTDTHALLFNVEHRKKEILLFSNICLHVYKTEITWNYYLVLFTWTELHTHHTMDFCFFYNGISCTYSYNINNIHQLSFFKAEHIFRFIARFNWLAIIYNIFIVSLNVVDQHVLLVDCLLSPSTNIANVCNFQTGLVLLWWKDKGVSSVPAEYWHTGHCWLPLCS